MHMNKERDVIMHNIKVSDLSFKYTDGDKMILKDISVDVNQVSLCVYLDSLDVEKAPF